MSSDKKENTNIHKDHRKKVKERYYVDGLDGMPPHNVLELLLFFGIPYKDTNPIAHELIDRFGSISGVFEAKRSDLLQVKGMTESAACLLSLILPIYKKYHQSLIERYKIFSNEKEIADFLRSLYLDNCNVEQVYVLCFDAKKHLLTYRKISEGDISGANFDMRKLASLVLETNASSVIISHNHPHGVAAPSYLDVQATITVIKFLSSLSVKVDDHIIVTDTEFFSMGKSSRFVHYFYNDFEQDEK